jgi:hypothetical protein
MKKLGYEKAEIDRLENVIGTISGAMSSLTIVFDKQTSLSISRSCYSALKPVERWSSSPVNTDDLVLHLKGEVLRIPAKPGYTLSSAIRKDSGKPSTRWGSS